MPGKRCLLQQFFETSSQSNNWLRNYFILALVGDFIFLSMSVPSKHRLHLLSIPEGICAAAKREVQYHCFKYLIKKILDNIFKYWLTSALKWPSTFALWIFISAKSTEKVQQLKKTCPYTRGWNAYPKFYPQRIF